MAINILMPALSPTMEEGKLAKWLKKEGDTVKSGDVIAEIETDKATMEVEAVDEGTLGKILVPEGTENVKVNVPIAVLLGEGEDASAAPKAPPAPPAASAAPAEAPATAPKAAPAPSVAPAPKTNGAGHAQRIFASPLAKRIAKEKGIDLAALAGSGPRGRIVVRDLEGAKPGAAPAAGKVPPMQAPALGDPRVYFEPGSYEEIPLDGMRKAIARRLTQSVQTTPHFYLSVDCEIDTLLEVRAALNARSPKGDGAYKLSVNDFIVKAAAAALMRFPAANVSWADDAMLRHKQADIGVAVAIPGGLITPIVRHAEAKGLAQISREVVDLAERARGKKLKPQEYEGGSFAISNLGMYGIKNFTAIINPPHSGILAVGRGEERAVVKNGQIVTANVMSMTLSVDHRAIDGAVGAEFLSILKGFIEDPAAMLL